MALPSSGILRLSDIKNEFPGEPVPKVSKYYRKGTRVPDIPNNSTIPISGRIRLSNFYGSQYFVSQYYELTINQSLQLDGGDYFYYGYFNNLSVPYHKVVHDSWKNAWSFSGSYTLKKALLSDFSLDSLKSSSYGSLQTESAGSFSTGYDVYALPFMIPKLPYFKGYTAPDPTDGYTMAANELMVQLTNTSGRDLISFEQGPAASNDYTARLYLYDGYPADAPYSFSLVYRWFVVTP